MTTLVQKLCEVMGAVGYIQKTGYNKQQGYRYVQEADIVEKVRAELVKRKIFLMNSVQDVNFRTIRTAKGSEITIATLTVKYTLIDGETGETLEFIGIGEGMDSGDKAVYKAQTGALKYALMKTFLIPTGDDPERDDEENDTNIYETSQPKKQPSQNPPKQEQQANVVPLHDKATDRQIKTIFGSAKNKLSEEEVKTLVCFTSGKETMKDLTKKEASQIIELIQNHSQKQLILLVTAQNKGLTKEQFGMLMKFQTGKEKLRDLNEQEINDLNKLIQETELVELDLLIEANKSLEQYEEAK